MTSPSEDGLPDHDHTTPATGPGRKHGLLREALEFLTELLGDFLAEIVMQAVSCALLVGVLIGLFWGWGRSPALTLGTVVVLLTGAVVTVAAVKARSHPDRRSPWLLGAAVLTIVGAVAVWFVFYGSNCGCV
ncbi:MULTISPECIES: hypothetical protein [unclassified Streptomyces]|uniref:Uncharacterized protein n=1 Tax=Streptomyces sp. NBC_00060 TaxID=2975636 RepID=A0AAU2HCN4_9ACTN